jgi:RimJ/RimL family protein N-acetyltransferase
MAELAFPAPPLADQVVLLRPWRETDAPAAFVAFSDPVVQRFSWPQPPPCSEEDTRGYFAELEEARALGEELHLALVRPGDASVVLGGGSVYDVRREQGCASVGYWLAPDARGRGIATHAVRLLARWAFTELGLARLEVTCSPDNEASQRVGSVAPHARRGWPPRHGHL